MNVIEIVHWDRFQHYKDRSPPWIKLHRQLLDNRAWNRCSHGASKMLVECWLVASESDDGSIELSTDDLAWRLRRDRDDVHAWLQELAALDFIELVNHDASKPLATRLHDATPEGEGEGETEGEENHAESDDSEDKPRDLKAFHGDAAPLIRQHWWRGKGPPKTAGRGWNMAREFSVLDGFVKRGEVEPADLLDGIPLARGVFGLTGPVTAKLFNVGGERQRLNQLIAAVRRKREKAAGDPMRQAGESADDVMRAVAHG